MPRVPHTSSQPLSLTYIPDSGAPPIGLGQFTRGEFKRLNKTLGTTINKVDREALDYILLGGGAGSIFHAVSRCLAQHGPGYVAVILLQLTPNKEST